VDVEQLPAHIRRELAMPGLGADEREMLLSALFSANWNKSAAADKLHWSRMTLYRKLAKYKLSPAPANGGKCPGAA
jgi:transcriptional regulator of acetoin/glycerol metabolism